MNAGGVDGRPDAPGHPVATVPSGQPTLVQQIKLTHRDPPPISVHCSVTSDTVAPLSRWAEGAMVRVLSQGPYIVTRSTAVFRCGSVRLEIVVDGQVEGDQREKE
ncbi:MAG: hypothetical protein ACYSVY_05215 [Planctomycetota bacterium]